MCKLSRLEAQAVRGTLRTRGAYSSGSVLRKRGPQVCDPKETRRWRVDTLHSSRRCRLTGVQSFPASGALPVRLGGNPKVRGSDTLPLHLVDFGLYAKSPQPGAEEIPGFVGEARASSAPPPSWFWMVCCTSSTRLPRLERFRCSLHLVDFGYRAAPPAPPASSLPGFRRTLLPAADSSRRVRLPRETGPGPYTIVLIRVPDK